MKSQTAQIAIWEGKNKVLLPTTALFGRATTGPSSSSKGAKRTCVKSASGAGLMTSAHALTQLKVLLSSRRAEADAGTPAGDAAQKDADAEWKKGADAGCSWAA